MEVDLCSSIEWACVADLPVKGVIKKLNDELRQCHFEIKGLNLAGEEVYGIVNTVSITRSFSL